MTVLSLATAQKIIDAALAHSKAQGYKPMGIAVLDESGQLKAFAREDGASMFRFDIARAKAWGAVGMGSSSRVLAQRAKDNPNFFVSLAATAEGKFLAQPGAVLVKNAAGDLLGAVGASGGTGDEDEAICIAGIEAAGLIAG
ncbi:heme-binding protein [Limnohabitans sp. Jir72]|uniref:GlcG/HbpS family heme-binding protein n=1 Tax=Limnohabitans sp. Jir72 TaxID=1977909 RepID=UPI000D3AA467|nr:heme-binding protein [Limnohabitans sp. Jir72]PUE35147.1 GlcG protein [Limnohabitans sp. Jir72]